MGMYDTYGELGIQLKVGERALNDYQVGDAVQIPDGIYVGHTGAIVIKDGMFIVEFSHLLSKWGDRLSPDEIILDYDFVKQTVAEMLRRLQEGP